MKIIKFRRPHFKYQDDSFSHFSYWGVKLTLKDSVIEFTSPSVNNQCYNKEDQMFTGLFDKQDKEIYEGDIVKFYKGYIDDTWTDTEQGQPYQMIWDEYALSFRANRKNNYLIPNNTARWAWYVIGNIYENPELLTPDEL